MTTMPELTPELEKAVTELWNLREQKAWREFCEQAEHDIRALVSDADDPLAAVHAAIEACR